VPLINEVANRTGQTVVSIPFELIFNRVIGDLGLILFVVLMAVAVYGRYKMRS
jgi:hypothetical protein